MRWLIVYLLAVAVIWLFVKNTTWRRGLLAVVTAAFAVLMIALVLTEGPPQERSPPRTDEKLSAVRQSEAVLYGALKPSDIAINTSSLTNTETVRFDHSGREIRQPNALQWRLETRITNRSADYAARDVRLNLMLYSCPPFFDTPQSDVSDRELRGACSRIGQRTVGLDNISLKPGASHDDNRIITFPNQLEASNPRYWIEVQSVNAERGN